MLSAHQVLAIKKEVSPAELDFLLRFPSKAGVTSPVDFLQPQGWGGIKVGHGSWCSPKCSIVGGLGLSCSPRGGWGGGSAEPAALQHTALC